MDAPRTSTDTFFSAVVIDITIKFAREGTLSELLYAHNLVLMSQTIKGLGDKFLRSKEAFESKGFKVNIGKTKVMVSGSITKDGMSKSKVDPCWICSLRVKANMVLFLKCSKWINGRCTGMKSVTPKSSINLMCRKCEGNRIFSLRLKGTVYMSYARPAILYGSEAWCLKESEIGILQSTERSMVRAICGVQLKDRKRSTD